MTTRLNDLKPSHLWKHFEKILEIPHCSGNEKKLGDYVLSVAAAHNLSARRDKVGNIVVEKKASPGYENAEGVILQGHLDMVGEKNSDTVHDFAKDPIRAYVEGEWVKAEGTTLGADNGIGLAAALAVMESDDLKHPPLEFLFTVDEETGLTGATRIKKGWLKGKKLFNLDSEDEGVFTIGCAGGADTEIFLPIKRKSAASRDVHRLKLTGFRGGHSGLDINQGRGNAIKLLARMLGLALLEFRFEIVSFEAGSKRNAIAREAWADLKIPPAQLKKLTAFFKKTFADIQTEYKAVETEAAWSLKKNPDIREAPLTSESQSALVHLLLALPHGVLAMHPEMKDLVETSTNLAIVRTTKSRIQIVCSSRSSIASALAAARLTIRAACELAGAKTHQPDGYPGWMPKLDSPLLKTLREVYAKTFGKQAGVAAVHAGLECGIIGEKHPGMDMISFGPTMRNPHSPDEKVHIRSVEKFWKFIVEALAALK
ncbi:MAG: aminoacyl-histidine dipeptidase [Acidobacteriota bacterium]|nr:aminoacyl-histidine dipeptidase [Acidobacteriota bacterium]